jgi:hypothetical protein
MEAVVEWAVLIDAPALAPVPRLILGADYYCGGCSHGR